MLIRYTYWALVTGILLGILTNVAALSLDSALGLWFIIMSAYVALEYITNVQIKDYNVH